MKPQQGGFCGFSPYVFSGGNWAVFLNAVCWGAACNKWPKFQTQAWQIIRLYSVQFSSYIYIKKLRLINYEFLVRLTDQALSRSCVAFNKGEGVVKRKVGRAQELRRMLGQNLDPPRSALIVRNGGLN